MIDFRLYRLCFIGALAALVIAAFSFEPIPEPLEPATTTARFDGARALAAARGLIAAAPDRAAGTDGDAAGAEYVRDRLARIAAGTVSQQSFETAGTDGELRNVIVTLPGRSQRVIAVVAARDSSHAPGAVSSAAATGTLLELAAELGATDHEATFVLASTDGSMTGGAGAGELAATLADPRPPIAALAISQPGAAKPRQPSLITSATHPSSPSAQLVETAQGLLEAEVSSRSSQAGGIGELARLAFGAAVGEQAVLIADGIDAVGISSAGEAPPAAARDGEDRLSARTLAAFGQTALATVQTLDETRAKLRHGPSSYIHFASNLVPGWAIALLALALILAPLPVAIEELARASRRAEGVGPALGWALGWTLPAVGSVMALYALALLGLIPRPDYPTDPNRFAIGPGELVALFALFGVGAGIWWVERLRRPPLIPSRQTLAAGLGLIAGLAALLAWIANPFLGLLLAPLAHLWLIQGRATQSRLIALAAALLACLPIAVALVELASALDWGSSAPWQFVLLVSGSTIGVPSAVALAVLSAGVLGVLTTRRAAGAEMPPPRERPPGEAPVPPPEIA